MRRTIRDVAREANVSIATVSRVINSKDKVKEETRLKILAAIEKLNFVPDHTARTMVQKKTKMIGFISPELASGYWSELSDVIQDEFWKKGYALLIGSHNKNKDKVYSILDIFQERNVDGIILGPLSNHKNETFDVLLNSFKNRGIPIVSLQGPNLTDITSVDVDHLGGARNVIEHLARAGHQRIAYIGGNSVSNERELGYRIGLTQHNLPTIEKIIILSENDQDFIEYGYKAAKKLISGKETFSAIFGGNDLIAIGALKALKEAGVVVPDEVSVVGFDDISASSMISPMLTTVKQPIREIGRTVVEVLVEQMDTEKETIIKKVILPTKLIIRET